MRNVLHLLQPECAKRNVVPALTADGPAWVMAEPVALDQIVHNLLLNALQALDQVPANQRTLRIGVLADPLHGVLTVSDSGPGITTEAMRRLFEPFYSTRDGGLGLGLSPCETLTSNMGGTLTAANQAGQGATFTLTLPAAKRT